MTRLIPGDFVFACNSVQGKLFLGTILTNSWHSPGGNMRYTGFGGINDFSAVAISPDGRYAMFGINVSPYLIWYDFDTEDIEDPFGGTFPTQPTSITFNPAGDMFVATFTASPYIAMYSYPGLVDQGAFTNPPISTTYRAAFTPDGSKIVACSYDSPFLHVWNATTRADITPTWTDGPTADCDYVACTNTIVAASGYDTGANLKVHDIATGASLHSETADHYQIKFSADGAYLWARGSATDSIQKYDTTTWAVENVSFSPSLAADVINNIASLRNIFVLGEKHLLVHGEGATFILDTEGRGVIAEMMNMNALVGQGAIHPDTAIGYVQGVVDDGAGSPVPLAREIIAVHRESGKVIAKTTSSAVNGTYRLVLMTQEAVNIYCVGESGEATQIADNVTPETTDPYVPPPVGAHRYWRFIATGPSSSNLGTLSELELYETTGGVEAVDTYSPTVTAGAEDYSSSVASAYDRNTGTWWGYDDYTAGDGWVQFDFGSGNEKEINTLAVTARSGQGFQCPRSFDLQYSDDGSTWVTTIEVTEEAAFGNDPERREYEYTGL